MVCRDHERYAVFKHLLSESAEYRYVIDLEQDYEHACVQILANTHDVYLISAHSTDNESINLLTDLTTDDPTIPLIFITSHADRALEKQAFAAGAADFINYNKLDRELVERTIRYAIKRKESEELIHQINRRNEMLLQSVDEGIIGLNSMGCITFCNPAALRLLGYKSINKLINQPNHILFNKKKNQKSEITLGTAEDATHTRPKKHQTQFVCADQSVIPVEYSVNPIINEYEVVEGYVIVFQDITLRQQTEQQLAYLAKYDPLTGLANRFLFLELLPQILSRADRQKTSVGLLFIDVDDFKKINDMWGHDVGDTFLKMLAERLRKNLRQSDLIVRLGGDEFTIILEPVKSMRAIGIVAQKLINQMNEPFIMSDREVRISASIGIVTYPECANNPDDLIKYADQAMYAAKNNGKNKFEFFTEKLNSQVKKRLNIETALRTALDNHEFEIYYQPQLDMKSQTIIGAEALLRWNNLELGRVSPIEFIPIAEESGLILNLGRWVIDTAIANCKTWVAKKLVNKPFKLAINISFQQFVNGIILSDVEDALVRHNINPAYIQLELTESSVMQDPELSISTLNHLRDIGISVSIDDFGTGYSSLSHLKSLPISVLKIDRDFVRNIHIDDSDMAIINTIITLAHTLGMRVIAEGVETEEQFNYLYQQQCDAMQGFLYYKPLNHANFQKMLEFGNPNRASA